MRIDTNEPEIIQNFSSRESLLKANAQLIADLQKRIMSRRFRPQTDDSVKLSYVRALIQSLGLQAAIIKDIELDAIKQELEEVRELVKNQSGYQGRQ